MTNKELIEKLKKLPENAVVFVQWYEYRSGGRKWDQEIIDEVIFTSNEEYPEMILIS